MDEKQKLLTFFEAENKRDWDLYATFLHPEIIWELHTDEKSVISGEVEYLKFIKEAYRKKDAHFICRELHASKNGRRLVTILENDSGELSCDIFEFREGLIHREYEFILG